MLKKSLTSALAVAVTLGALATPAAAGPLENLERERADLLSQLLRSDLDAAAKDDASARARHRLVDLERIVLRDKDLLDSGTPVARKAMENYDLTFLVHASVEGNRTVLDHWLEQVGVTTDALGTARVGRR